MYFKHGHGIITKEEKILIECDFYFDIPHGYINKMILF